jgi:hypothetical protein
MKECAFGKVVVSVCMPVSLTLLWLPCALHLLGTKAGEASVQRYAADKEVLALLAAADARARELERVRSEDLQRQVRAHAGSSWRKGCR